MNRSNWNRSSLGGARRRSACGTHRRRRNKNQRSIHHHLTIISNFPTPPPPRGSAAVHLMSHSPPNPSFLAPPAAASLYKQNSWSPDSHRDEAWLRQKGRRRQRRSRSVTDEDLDELKACIELGFDFDSPEMDRRLSETFPAYGLYYAVNKQYNDAVSRSPPACSPTESEGGPSSPHHSPHAIYCAGNNPQRVKTRLRQWAQVVACTVRQAPS